MSSLSSSRAKNGVLPKYIVVILDDDLIDYLNFKAEGAATLMGTWIEWLTGELQSLINDRISQLPVKCKVKQFFYWVTAPIHNYFSKECNAMRIKFNLSLESVLRTKDTMRAIKLKDHWNSKDSAYIINNRFSDVSLSAYWKAIDSTFQYNMTRCEVYLAKRMGPKQENQIPDCQTQSDVDTGHGHGDQMYAFFERKCVPFDRRQERFFDERRMDAREDWHN